MEPRWGLDVVREYFQSTEHETRHRLWQTFSEQLESQFSPTDSLQKASNEIERRQGKEAAMAYLDDHDYFNTDMELCVMDGVLQLWVTADLEEHIDLYEEILRHVLLLRDEQPSFDLSTYRMKSFSKFCQEKHSRSAVLDVLRSISKQAARSVWKYIYHSSYDFALMQSQENDGFKKMDYERVTVIFENMWRNAGKSLNFPGDVATY